MEEVIHDLDNMEIDDLRLLARQNDLRYDGTKSELLLRIKVHFGCPNEKMYIQESSQNKAEIFNLSGATSSSLSTAGPSTSATDSRATGMSSAEVLPGFVKDGSSSSKRSQSPAQRQSSNDRCSSSPKRARSPERRLSNHDRSSRSNSRDRRSSSEDKDFQEFNRIVTEQPTNGENRNGEF